MPKIGFKTNDTVPFGLLLIDSFFSFKPHILLIIGFFVKNTILVMVRALTITLKQLNLMFFFLWVLISKQK